MSEITKEQVVDFIANMTVLELSQFIKELEEEENKSLNYSVMDYQDFYYRMSIKDRFVTTLLATKHTIITDTENVLSDA